MSHSSVVEILCFFFLCGSEMMHIVQGGGAEGHPAVEQLQGPAREVHRRVCESGQLPPLHWLYSQREEEGGGHGGDEEGNSLCD